VEAVATNVFVRQRDATSAQRLAGARQIELLQQAATFSAPPPLGPLHGLSARPSLPPHLEGPVPPLSLGQQMTTNLSAGFAAHGTATPMNAAPQAGIPRPEEDVG